LGQEPRPLYYAIPGFQQSPNGPDDIQIPSWPLSANKPVPLVGKTPLEVVAELEYVSIGYDGSESQEGMTHYAQQHKVRLSYHIFRNPVTPIIALRIFDTAPLDAAGILATSVYQTPL
jgi:hypothetical protein